MKKSRDYRMDFLLVGVIITSVLLLLLLTHCISDLGEVVLAIISGLWASFTTLLIEELLKQLKFSNRLNPLSGKEWKGYSLKDNKLHEHISNAVIEYRNDTLLNISVKEIKEPGRDWSGCIEMNEKMLNKGAVTYKYKTDHESGYKEILFEEDDNSYYLYLLPVTNEIKIKEGNTLEYKYGIEVFKKDK